MRRDHAPVVVGAVSHDVSHLNAFGQNFIGKGRDAGTNLIIEVSISSHVYSKRCDDGLQGHLVDSRGNIRHFCTERHALSQNLPAYINSSIRLDSISSPSEDHNGASNLALFDLGGGHSYCVIYYFEPSPSNGIDLNLKVISAYAKPNFRSSRGNKMSYYARRSLFSNKRVP